MRKTDASLAARLLHRFSSGVQFTTTLIGVTFVSSTRVLIRKRCPSAVTA